MAERAALYRLYNAAGELLYIGMSDNPSRRFVEHATSQPWRRKISVRETGAWYESRAEAHEAEMKAIRAEAPRYNEHRGIGAAPVRNIRVANYVWFPALAKAQAEGRSLTAVITAYLRRYISTPPRPPKT